MATVLATVNFNTNRRQCMNTKHYDEIVEQFKEYHPYLANGMKDWRPKGDMGIRDRKSVV